MSYLVGTTVTLDIYTAAMPVAATNSMTGRGCLMQLMTGDVGLVLFVFKEDFNAFAMDEVWYVLIRMLVEKVL